jgi:hypothetical protein
MSAVTSPHDAWRREARIGTIMQVYLPDFCWQSASEVFEFLRHFKPGFSYDSFKTLLRQWAKRGLIIRVPTSAMRATGHRYLYRRMPR